MKIVGFGLVAVAGLALAGCQKQAAQDKVENKLVTISTTDANGSPTIITDKRLVLPAVKGNPAALYFTIANKAKTDLVITSVHVESAKETMMHETVGGTMNMLDTVTVPAGGAVAFAPGGKHVMVMGLSPAITKDSEQPYVTFQFKDGSKEAVPFKVEAAGAAADMSAMKM